MRLLWRRGGRRILEGCPLVLERHSLRKAARFDTQVSPPIPPVPRPTMPIPPAARLLLVLLPTPAFGQGETVYVTTTSDVSDFGGAQLVGNLPGPDGQVSMRE